MAKTWMPGLCRAGHCLLGSSISSSKDSLEVRWSAIPGRAIARREIWKEDNYPSALNGRVRRPSIAASIGTLSDKHALFLSVIVGGTLST